MSTTKSNDFPVVSSKGNIGNALATVLTKANGSEQDNSYFKNPVVIVQSTFTLDKMKTVGSNDSTYESLAKAASKMNDFRVDLSSSAMMSYIKSVLVEAQYGGDIQSVVVLAQTVIQEKAGDTGRTVDTPEVHVFNRLPIFSAWFLSSARRQQQKVSYIPMDIALDTDHFIGSSLTSQVNAVTQSLSQHTTLPKWLVAINNFMMNRQVGDPKMWTDMLSWAFHDVEFDIALLLNTYGSKNEKGLIPAKKFYRYTSRVEGNEIKLGRAQPKFYIHELSRFTTVQEGEIFARSSNQNIPFTSYVAGDSCSKSINSITCDSVFPGDEVGEQSVGGLYTLAVLTDADLADREAFKAAHNVQNRPIQNRQNNNQRNMPTNPYSNNARKGFTESFIGGSQPSNPYANQGRGGAPGGNRNNNMNQNAHVPQVVYIEPVNNTFINYDRLSSMAVAEMS